MTAARSAARAIAAIGLGESSNIVVEPQNNNALLRLLRAERIEGVGVAGLVSGVIDADSSFAGALVERHDETMAQTLRVEIAAVVVSGLLSDAGIAHRILKGTALAHTAAHQTAERSFRDVDVLVEGRSIDRAIQVLTNKGAIRNQAQLRPGFDSRFAKSVTMQLNGVEVDVHRLLCAGPFGVLMCPGDLFLVRETIAVGGIDLPTLDRTDHLIHACYHAALGSPTPALVNLRDIALLASQDWDAERFGQTVSRWQGHAVVQRAVKLVEAELAIELPQAIRGWRNRPVPTAQRELVEPYLSTNSRGRFADLAPATLRALPIADRVAYARAVGLPDGTDVIGRIKDLVNRRR